MSYQTLNATRALNRRDIFDLARAGFVLAVTVLLALLVPPKVFGADPHPNNVPTVEAAK
jgi:hypothetical protein